MNKIKKTFLFVFVSVCLRTTEMAFSQPRKKRRHGVSFRPSTIDAKQDWKGPIEFGYAGDMNKLTGQYSQTITLHCNAKCDACKKKRDDYISKRQTHSDDSALMYCLGMTPATLAKMSAQANARLLGKKSTSSTSSPINSDCDLRDDVKMK